MLHRSLAAADGLLAPLGSGKLSHTPPPHAQAPWPHAHSAQRQPSQVSLCWGLDTFLKSGLLSVQCAFAVGMCQRDNAVHLGACIWY